MLTSGGVSRSVLKCHFSISSLAGARRRPRVPVSSRPRRARRGPHSPRSRALAAGDPPSVEPLDGDFLAASDEGRNDGAVWRVFVFFYDQEISVGYVRPDHGLPHDPQEVAPPARAGPHELRRQRVGLIPHRHGLEPASGGDPTQQRYLTRCLPTLLRQPDAARPPTLPLDIPGLLQLFEMLVRGLGTPQAHSLPHLAHAQRPLSLHVRAGQAPEHLHPYLPVLRDHPRLL